MAMTFALRAMGKEVRVVLHDAPPPPLQGFPGVDGIEVADRVDGQFDAVIVLECPDMARCGVQGLDNAFLINVDHHPGNAMFGAINWFDGGAAACGEMVFDIIQALEVPLSCEMATHLYIAILTDTGSFHFSSLSARTFDISRQLMEAGIDPVSIARTVYDSNTVERLKLFGAVLNSMEIGPTGRSATLLLNDAIIAATGGSYDDTEGLINMPLTVKAIQAVVFFKESKGGAYRVSMRSKGSVDIGAVAKHFGGGGHKNAAGCTVTGSLEAVRQQIDPLVDAAIRTGLGG